MTDPLTGQQEIPAPAEGVRNWRVEHGDCLALMAAMPEASVDAIVTDPPAGISFMGRDWDHDRGGMDAWVEWLASVLREANRVARPGAHALVWALPRTSHWTGMALERAGWEVRDVVTHHFGTGFPKSLDVSKAIDKAAPRTGMFAGFAAHFGERRQVMGLSQKDIAAHFPSKTGGLTGCAWNWENGANVPTLEQWTVLQPMLGLASEWLPLIQRVEAERERVGIARGAQATSTGRYGGWGNDDGAGTSEFDITAPATPEAEQWQGWGTALKPATEFWFLARKPLIGTVAANVTEFGTGAINVDACRLNTPGRTTHAEGNVRTASSREGNVPMRMAEGPHGDPNLGRWPANVVLSHSGCVETGTRRVKAITGARAGSPDSSGIYGNGMPRGDGRNTSKGDADGMETMPAWECEPGCPVAELDAQSGELHSHGGGLGQHASGNAASFGGGLVSEATDYRDRGGASRFFFVAPIDTGAERFRYVAKASRRERDAGLDGLEPKGRTLGFSRCAKCGRQKVNVPGSACACPEPEWVAVENHSPRPNGHPTVKPIALMRWLVRLVTPPGGTCLDPFAGSGSTGCAAVLEGFNFIGIEKDPEYVAIARARIAWWAQHPDGMELSKAIHADRERTTVRDSGQMGMFSVEPAPQPRSATQTETEGAA